jgi:hypothetical protein
VNFSKMLMGKKLDLVRDITQVEYRCRMVHALAVAFVGSMK